MSDATFAYCRGAGFGKVLISIRSGNRGAQAFYARLGFQPCGRLVGQVLMDGHYEDQLLYELFL
jgi:RimJ/RimL family protein N-acetyltransferase